MPVSLGAKREHGVDEPLGLLGDCHRRIEQFLGSILRVLDRADGRALDVSEREALETSLSYFRSAAPRHTADEEESLFPRMRASSDPRVRPVLAKLEALKEDHHMAAAGHAEVEFWCRRWLDAGPLAPPQVRRLRGILESLVVLYERHIAVEEQEVFPLAKEALDAEQLSRISWEMAQRRGITTISPSPKAGPAMSATPTR